MTSGVVGAKLGVLTVRDARGALGRELDTLDSLHVLVPTTVGLPFAGIVQLGLKRSGPALHRALVCPACTRCVLQLVVKHGKIACRKCNRSRRRRELERTTHAWNMEGAREEDALVRLIVRRVTPAGLARAQALAEALVTGDNVRAAAIIERAHLLLAATENRP
jgi:DNA polymerase III epsilon subunit-like protein